MVFDSFRQRNALEARLNEMTDAKASAVPSTLDSFTSPLQTIAGFELSSDDKQVPPCVRLHTGSFPACGKTGLLFACPGSFQRLLLALFSWMHFPFSLLNLQCRIRSGRCQASFRCEVPAFLPSLLCLKLPACIASMRCACSEHGCSFPPFFCDALNNKKC